MPVPPLAPADSCTLAPAQIVEGVAVAVALNAPPEIVIVTWSDAEQDPEVAVRVKSVVDVRFTVVGSTTVAFTSEVAGSQL